MDNGKLRKLKRKNKIPKLCDYHRENKLNVMKNIKRDELKKKEMNCLKKLHRRFLKISYNLILLE